MNIDTYQTEAMKLRLPTADREYALLNLAAEAGEVLGKAAKLRRDGGEKDRVVWEQVYAPNESGYVGEEEPDRCADMIVDTNGADLLVKTNW
jgi:hypothetical protein